MGMDGKKLRHILIVMSVIIFLSGCAPRLIPRAYQDDVPAPLKVCGESPEWTIRQFAENLSLRFFEPLKRLIVFGKTILSVFGGHAKVLDLSAPPDIQWERPEDVERSDIIEVYSSQRMADGVMRVILERTITITPIKPSLGEERESKFYRAFNVIYETGSNCIAYVVSSDREWRKEP